MTILTTLYGRKAMVRGAAERCRPAQHRHAGSGLPPKPLDVLAAEPRLFLGGLRMKTDLDTRGMPLQPQELLEEGARPGEI